MAISSEGIELLYFIPSFVICKCHIWGESMGFSKALE